MHFRGKNVTVFAVGAYLHLFSFVSQLKNVSAVSVYIIYMAIFVFVKSEFFETKHHCKHLRLLELGVI